MTAHLFTPEARQKAAETRKKNKLTPKPSKSRAIRAYYKDFVGLDTNPKTEELRSEFKAILSANKGLKPTIAIRNICTDCVGDNFDGLPSRLINNCKITNCKLYTVRPMANLASEGSV